jgi:hypothetical protein
MKESNGQNIVFQYDLFNYFYLSGFYAESTIEQAQIEEILGYVDTLHASFFPIVRATLLRNPQLRVSFYFAKDHIATINLIEIDCRCFIGPSSNNKSSRLFLIFWLGDLVRTTTSLQTGLFLNSLLLFMYKRRHYGSKTEE